MRFLCFILILLCVLIISCKKAGDKPKSKIDYIPINAAITPKSVITGQPIVSRVNLGFYSYSADIKFLNLEIKEVLSKQYEIRAKASYSNIQYDISLPVVSTFDTTLTLQTTTSGQYILNFYSTDKLTQADTVQVN